MAVRLRLTRLGKRNQPYYRLAAFDSRTQRDGRSLEILGTYNPREEDEAKKLTLKRDRILHWIEKGARPTEAVASLLKKQGIHVK